MLKTRRLRKMFIDANSKSHTKNDNEDEESEALLDNRCCICLEQILEKTKPEECRHIFCQTCILSWTRFSNLCPLCKTEIKHLHIYSSENEITDTLTIDKPAQADELTDFIAEFAESCYICSTNDNE